MPHERERSAGFVGGPRRYEDQEVFGLVRESADFEFEHIIIPTAFAPGNGSGGGAGVPQEYGPIATSGPASLTEWIMDNIGPVIFTIGFSVAIITFLVITFVA